MSDRGVQLDDAALRASNAVRTRTALGARATVQASAVATASVGLGTVSVAVSVPVLGDFHTGPTVHHGHVRSNDRLAHLTFEAQMLALRRLLLLLLLVVATIIEVRAQLMHPGSHRGRCCIHRNASFLLKLHRHDRHGK